MNLMVVVRDNFNPQYHFGNLIIAILLIAVVVVVSMHFARNFSRTLEEFVEKNKEFEKRGAATTSLFTLLRSCGRVFSEWWSVSGGIITSLLSIIAFGYLVPTLMLAVSIAIGAWFDDHPAFHTMENRQITVADIIETSVFMQADAATLGAVSQFELFSPSNRIVATSLFGRFVLFAFGVVAAVSGSLSLFRLVGIWIGNLLSRLTLKIEKYARRRQQSGLQPVTA